LVRVEERLFAVEVGGDAPRKGFADTGDAGGMFEDMQALVGGNDHFSVDLSCRDVAPFLEPPERGPARAFVNAADFRVFDDRVLGGCVGGDGGLVVDYVRDGVEDQ
jgi:hypothetical protein